MSCVRFQSVRLPDPASGGFTVATWNAERCMHIEESARLIANSDADLVLLSEMDIGMARSDNRDTVGELAELLGMTHVAAVEFIELGLGDERETRLNEGKANLKGLHCNAILSRFELERPSVVRLDSGGSWFAGRPGKGQRRAGGRIALAARMGCDSPCWVVSTHFESEGNPMGRANECARLIAGLNRLCGIEPAIIGGDFNFASLPEADGSDNDWFAKPDSFEPAFRLLEQAGFEWSAANTPEPTTRPHVWTEQWSPRKLDWLFTRGVTASRPRILPVTTPCGFNLSDHELLLAEIDSTRSRQIG